MSAQSALTEIKRFLRTADAEVLSISGRWGVGKTFAWSKTLKEAKDAGEIALSRYAYVSAFGLKSIEEVKNAILQCTVRLDRENIEPTVESLLENITSAEGLGALVEAGARKGAAAFQKIAEAIPYVGKASSLIVPTATLLIRNQIVCIDDIERAGTGLEVADLLGLVSMLREERNCKVVLLLNEAGLADEEKKSFKSYLEKVVDQAIQYVPTPHESADLALPGEDKVSALLRERAAKLGLTNIRVIKKVRRFFSHIEPTLDGLRPEVLEQAATTLMLLGWSVFEPSLSPPVEHIRLRSSWSEILRKDEPTTKEAAWNALIDSYGFGHVDDFDAVLLDGLLMGSFDQERLQEEARKLDKSYSNIEARKGIRAPWEIYGGNFEDNEEILIASLKDSVENFGDNMSPNDLNNVISVLEELRGEAEARSVVDVYMEKQKHQKRGFFDLSEDRRGLPEVAPYIREAFDKKLKSMPIEWDPVKILVDMETRGGWNPTDIDRLSSLSEEDFYQIFKNLRDDDLRSVIRSALRFETIQGCRDEEIQVSKTAKNALIKISKESKLNSIRLKPYISKEQT